MKLKCLRCGREFEGASTAIHCPECVDIIKHTYYYPRICKDCGASFMGGTSALYCPDCRAERKKKQKLEYEARKRAGNVRKIGSIDNCVICGKPYTVEGGNQKYCPDCAPEAVHTIRLEYARESAKKNLPKRAENRQKARVEIPCAICGKMFMPKGNFKTCSKACSEKLAQKLGREWQEAHKEEMAEKNKEWFRKNKERRAKYSREKRIREKEAKEKANSSEGTSPPMGRGDTERG